MCEWHKICSSGNARFKLAEARKYIGDWVAATDGYIVP